MSILRSGFASLAVACLSFVAHPSAFATTPAGESPGNLMGFDEAFNVDSVGVADALGISPEEARSRLSVEHHAGDIIERIRIEHSARLAGLYMDHEGGSKIVVRLTGHDAVRTELHQFGEDRLEVVYELGADRTFAAANQELSDNIDILSKSADGWHGGYVDERNGEIVLYALSDTKTSGQQLAHASKSMFSSPARVVRVSEPERNQVVFGSGHLTFPVQPSPRTAECTAGFTVQLPNQGRQGLLTAGHCISANNTYNYRGVDQRAYTLTHVARVHTAVADVGWMLGPTGTQFGPFFYADAWRQVTGLRTRSRTAIGQQVCKYGINGGWGCATVRSIDHSPGNICGPNGTTRCSNTYVHLGNAVDLCQGGDSGGPWFIGTVAAGIHKSNIPSQGLCTYTSLDYAYSDLGVQLIL